MTRKDICISEYDFHIVLHQFVARSADCREKIKPKTHYSSTLSIIILIIFVLCIIFLINYYRLALSN
ncbi:MAG: hypothetical protein ISQ21_00845 [Alphaproteobacteria bacterium]|nr:hypothetical protein [Alphaproteobacteria bacterium]